MNTTTVTLGLTLNLHLPLVILRQSSGNGSRPWKLHLELAYPTLGTITLALDTFDGDRPTRRQVTLTPTENAQVLYAAGERVEVSVLSVSAPTFLTLRLTEGVAGLAVWTTTERIEVSGMPVMLQVPPFAVDLKFFPLMADLIAPETVLLLTDEQQQVHQMPIVGERTVPVLPGYRYQVPAKHGLLQVTYTCCG